MTRIARLSLALVVLSAAPAAAEPPAKESGLEDGARKAYDLVVMRPLNLVTTAVSLAGAVVAYPVAWPFGGEDQVVEYLVKEPIERTFRRPLGDF